MPTVKEALAKLKWHHARLDDAVVHYTHRGAPGDSRAIRGADIHTLGASFFTIQAPDGATSIPYHRIQRVEVDGAAYWVRQTLTLGEMERKVRAAKRGPHQQL